MDEKNVVLKVKFTADEYFKSIYNVSNMLAIRIIVAVVVATILAPRLLGISDTYMPDALLLLALTAVIGTVTFFGIPFIIKRAYVKRFNNNKFIQQERTFTLTPDSLESVSENDNAKYTWNDLYSYRETNDMFYVFLIEKQFYMLPKRCFDNESDINIARGYLRNIPIRKDKKKFGIFTKKSLIYLGLFILIILVALIFRMIS